MHRKINIAFTNFIETNTKMCPELLLSRQRIRCSQVMQICSDQCVQHSSMTNSQIFHAVDVNPFLENANSIENLSSNHVGMLHALI